MSAMTGAGAPVAVDASPVPRRRLIVIFIGLLLGVLMAAMDQTIMATALPTIASNLHGMDEISWIISAYLLAQTVSMPVYGKLGDFIGRKRAFHLAIVIFLVGSVLSGTAPSMAVLIVFRGLQGVGAGGLIIGAQTIIAELVSARERGKYMSIMGPMIGLATVFGPLLGGFLTETASWRWIFYINLPIGIAAIVVTGRVLHLPRGERNPRVDWLGSTFMVGGVGCLVLVLTWGGRRFAWGSPTILALIVAAAVLFPLWLLAERHAAEPILPLRLFRDEVFRLNAPLAFLLGASMFAAVSYLPTYLQLSLGVSATYSGVLMLPLMGGLMVSAVGTGQIMSRTGRYKVFPVIGAALAGVGMYLLSLMNPGTTRGESSICMAVLGVGIGFIMPTLVLTVQNSVGQTDMGPATAGINFFRQIGASCGTALVGSLFVSRLTTDLRHTLPPAMLSQLGKHAEGMSPDELRRLPPGIAHDFVVSYANALTPLYAYVAPLLAVALILALLLKEKPLLLTVNRAGGAQRGAGHD
jgi:EmrB/QacA subfamily drug resistance transporter